MKRTLHSYFNKTSESQNVEVAEPLPPVQTAPTVPTPLVETTHVINTSEINLSNLERDPGLRKQMFEYAVNQRDEIRRAYIMLGPYQPKPPLDKSFKITKGRRFVTSWYKLFPDWLEYSPSKDCAFCLPCFLCCNPSERFGSKAFIIEGFRAWKKVNDGKNCAFLVHVGNSNSPHRLAIQRCRDLSKPSQHLVRVVEKQNLQQIANNRLRLKTSIDAVRWLTFGGCAFRGNDESLHSKNRGNYLRMLEILASYNKDVNDVILQNAPKNASYTSPQIQKEILSIFASKVQGAIRSEIGDAKFCIIVDEARDEAKREQMSIVIRFVDKFGFVQERFFAIIHVLDTASSTLKNEICKVLLQHNLNIQHIRGQGYDGASNMRGEWNGLQALFLKDCPFAYYIHCLAHRLQLTLVAASKVVVPVYEFFEQVNSIINIASSSCKRSDLLKNTQANELESLINSGEIETGRGLNQIGSLQRPADTRWSSHLNSIRSLMKMYNATLHVLKCVINGPGNYIQHAESNKAYDLLTSYNFVFILHLMKEVMEITDDLCQALQRKSQDILNAMSLVTTTKSLLQQLREEGCDSLFEKVQSFCEKYEIEIPNMNDPYRAGRGRARVSITFEHYFRVDIFNATIDSQLTELNFRFNEKVVELLVLSSSLDPRDCFSAFDVEAICKLASSYYPEDFSEQEKLHLKFQLEHYALDVRQHSEFQNLTTLSKLCQVLVKTKKLTIYPLIDRLIRLVLTLPVSTATTERAFSAMKFVKNKLRNKMEDDFLEDYLIVYIEKDIAEKIDNDSIIDAFYKMKSRRLALE